MEPSGRNIRRMIASGEHCSRYSWGHDITVRWCLHLQDCPWDQDRIPSTPIAQQQATLWQPTADPRSSRTWINCVGLTGTEKCNLIVVSVLFLTAVDQKQIDCQIFLRQSWVYLGSAENCNSGSATTVSCVQVPRTAREGELFYRGGKEVGRALVNKESMAFHWLKPCQGKGVFILLTGVGPYLCRVSELPLLVSQLYLICLINFLINRCLFINFLHSHRIKRFSFTLHYLFFLVFSRLILCKLQENTHWKVCCSKSLFRIQRKYCMRNLNISYRLIN